MKAIIFDWDGTIAKKEVATNAALKELKFFDLNISIDELHQKQKNHEHYNDIHEVISDRTGIKNKLMLNQIMTNFFQYYYLTETNKDIFYEGMFDVLKKLKKKYKLIIATNLRADTIKHVLKKIGCELFDELYGNSYDLRFTKTELVKLACEKNDCVYMIGDREDDVNAGKVNKLKTIMVKWGYAINHKDNAADYLVHNTEELLKIIY